jgi:hypothetical protein
MLEYNIMKSDEWLHHIEHKSNFTLVKDEMKNSYRLTDDMHVFQFCF